MIKRLTAGAASLALTLGGVALAATPAQALTGAACDDGDAWSWSIANPARYQAGPHEAVLGLSDAIRTVTIKAPTGCTVEAGDTWRVYNGYFSAAGTFNAEEAAAGKDTDRVSVKVPTSNAVAGDEIPVKLKVNDSSAGIPGVWDVDESNAGSLVLLRRTLFKYKGVTDRMDFGNEPYICGEFVDGAAPGTRNDQLNRASFNLGRLVAVGALDHHETAAAPIQQGEALGLTAMECERTVASGLAAGMEQPRSLAL
jgi:hypothetical protein